MEKLILQNQIAMMEWMMVTGMAPISKLRKQTEATEAALSAAGEDKEIAEERTS